MEELNGGKQQGDRKEVGELDSLEGRVMTRFQEISYIVEYDRM